jgi:hypothetical protein
VATIVTVASELSALGESVVFVSLDCSLLRIELDWARVAMMLTRESTAPARIQ